MEGEVSLISDRGSLRAYSHTAENLRDTIDLSVTRMLCVNFRH